jgi:outer membrane lipoprotein-sorting protein
MIIKRQSDQRGIAHIIEIVVIAAIVLGVGGFIAWRVMDAQKNQQASTSKNQPLADVPCNLSDKDLCKFFTSWKANGQYKVTSSQTADGKTTTSTYEASNNGANYHMIMTVEGAPYEIIGVGDTLYTKDASDGKWWKQQLPKAQENTVKGNYNYDFKEPASDSPQPAAQEPTYTKIGKEACGSLTCFKYQTHDPASPNDKTFIWFDDKDYQMRRYRVEMADGSISDQTFAYSSVNITAPSPTKDLGPNQYIVPGQSAPITAPSADDLKNLYNSGQ